MVSEKDGALRSAAAAKGKGAAQAGDAAQGAAAAGRQTTQGGAGYVLHLSKQDFKFSAAHFTLFPDGSGEFLHGHNFQLGVELSGPELGALGLLVDVAGLKQEIRALCKSLDERTLIPEQSPLLKIDQAPDAVSIRFSARRYTLPEGDVLLLPLSNITMELLAKYLWRKLAAWLQGNAATVGALCVEVEESAGQSCRYTAPLEPLAQAPDSA